MPTEDQRPTQANTQILQASTSFPFWIIEIDCNQQKLNQNRQNDLSRNFSSMSIFKPEIRMVWRISVLSKMQKTFFLCLSSCEFGVVQII